MESADLGFVVDLKERGYSYAASERNAPRDLADARDNWRLVLEILGDICANVIAPRAPEADEEGASYENGHVTYAKATQAAIEAFRKSEILGCMLPWEYGGLNLPETVYQAMIEMVSRAEGGLMTIFGLQEIASTINEFADDEIKARILPRFSRGEVFGAMVLTEPDAGSDLGSVQCRAILDEATGKWRINGVKRFITNGNADIHLVLARSEDGSKDARGLSMFLVEKDETVRIRRIEHKLGIHSSPTCEIQYHDTPALLVGKRRFGLMRCAMALMNGARLAVAAQAVGISEASYREALRYAGERAQFGKNHRRPPGGREDARLHEGRDRSRARPHLRDLRMGRYPQGLRAEAGGAGKGRSLRRPGPHRPQEEGLQPRRYPDALEQILCDRDGQPRLLQGHASPRRRRLHAGIQRRAALSRRAHHQHLRRYQPAPSRRGNGQDDGTRTRRPLRLLGGYCPFPRACPR